MKTSDFDFFLPEELIAQTPLDDRSSSKLLVMDKNTGEIQDKAFSDIINYLNEGDVLVLNNTRVIPARIFGKKDTGAIVEFLLLERIDLIKWKTMVKPGKKARKGSIFDFNGLMKGIIVDEIEEGLRIIEFDFQGNFEHILDQIGNMPLPPYINHTLKDKERYQTVFSKYVGSSAAPTAGLHFTQELLRKISDKSVNIVYVTLHVGLGTFRPVKVENIYDHKMHSEKYSLSEETVKIINNAKERGNKIVAVGTTSTRTLEGVFLEFGELRANEGETDIFIYPGFEFKVVDRIITNFHLPQSTLLMLISAFSSKENILSAYTHAINHKYRFFSFGDSMLIK